MSEPLLCLRVSSLRFAVSDARPCSECAEPVWVQQPLAALSRPLVCVVCWLRRGEPEPELPRRPPQADARYEPGYPGHEIVTMTGAGDLVSHPWRSRCGVTSPHTIKSCGEFEWR